MIGIALALTAAASWGTGDFLGGLATRKLHQFQVLFVTAVSSTILLFICMLVWQESLPARGDLLIAVLAGLSGALGLAALYKGLSLGHAALVSSVSGVIGASIPTLAGMWLEGFPGPVKLLGFGLALSGIWLITKKKDANEQPVWDSLGLAFLGGLGLGGFLVVIAQVEGGQVFAPLVFAKLATIALAFGLLKWQHLSVPVWGRASLSVWSGVVDTGGNVFYLLATQFTRLDIAALLSSFYPAATVLLSSLVLKEKLSRPQWLGVSMCITAILLITSG